MAPAPHPGGARRCANDWRAGWNHGACDEQRVPPMSGALDLLPSLGRAADLLAGRGVGDRASVHLADHTDRVPPDAHRARLGNGAAESAARRRTEAAGAAVAVRALPGDQRRGPASTDLHMHSREFRPRAWVPRPLRGCADSNSSDGECHPSRAPPLRDAPVALRGTVTHDASQVQRRRRPARPGGTDVRALTWQGREDVRVETVPDPRIEQPTDAIVRVTSTAICGSDLHLYGVLGMYLEQGRHPRSRGDGRRRGGRAGRVAAEGRRPGGGAVRDRVRDVLDVHARADVPVRDDAGPRPGQGCRAVRVHQALRAGPRRPGAVPAGAAGPVRTGGRPGRRVARRAVPVPVGRPAHGVAGGRVRAGPVGRHGGRGGARADRPDVGPHRRAPRSRRGSSASTSCPSGWTWPAGTASTCST